MSEEQKSEPGPEPQKIELTVEKVASKVLDKVDLLKYLGNWGLAGLIVGYLMLYSIPETRNEFSKTLDRLAAEHSKTLDKIAGDHKDERKEAREHGSTAAKDLSEAITKNADSIQNLNETFIRVQERTQQNQQTLIELQLKKMNEDKNK